MILASVEECWTQRHTLVGVFLCKACGEGWSLVVAWWRTPPSRNWSEGGVDGGGVSSAHHG